MVAVVVQAIGANVAAASPTVAGSADLVSAATNTDGIIITSASMFLKNGAADGTLQLKVNGNIVFTARDNSTMGSVSLGGFCAIKVPAGQAVSYTLVGSAQVTDIRITWKAI